MADDFKYHIDHHASLTPPAELAQARAAHLDSDALQAATDAAIVDALRMQRRLGLAALSDGEFRRRNDPAAPAAPGPLAELVGPAHAAEVWPLVATPAEHGRLLKHETDFLLSSTDRPTMVALPAPGFVAELAGGPDASAAGAALARIVRDEVAALAGDGIRHVLLRNPAYTFLLTEEGRRRAESLGIDAASTIARMLEADAAAIAGLDPPAEFRVSLDLTTGGAAAGPWHAAAVQDFLDRQPFGRLCVEFPGPVAERFPIERLPAGLVVSLGIVDVTDPTLETVDELVARIDDAAQLVDLDDIALATNGGFHLASGASWDGQRAKLQRVEMVARYFWGNEL